MKNLIFFFLIGFYTLCNAQIDETAYFNYLQQTYLEHESDTSWENYLQNELVRFQELLPNDVNEDHVIWMLANLKFTSEDYEASLLYSTKLIYLHPKSQFLNSVKANIDSIFKSRISMGLFPFEEKFRFCAEKKQAFPSHREAFFDWLNFIFSLEYKPFYALLTDEIALYERIYRQSIDNGDVLNYWRAFICENLQQWHDAAGWYGKVFVLYPQSGLRDEALYHYARIHYRRLRQIDPARDGFLEVINSYPNSELAGYAQFYLAELYDEHPQNEEEALHNYRLFTEAFSDHPFNLRALKRIAAITLKAEKYEEAATALMQLFEQYPDSSSAPAALDTLAEIFTTHLQNYKRAANTYVLFATTYRDHPKAAQYLYRAAEIHLNQLKDRKTAEDICRQIVKIFKDSPYVKKAKLLLENN